MVHTARLSLQSSMRRRGATVAAAGEVPVAAEGWGVGKDEGEEEALVASRRVCAANATANGFNTGNAAIVLLHVRMRVVSAVLSFK